MNSPFNRRFWMGLAVVSVGFIPVLWRWLSLALEVDLHSHVILIPFITGYLIWIREKGDQPGDLGGGNVLAIVLGVLGVGAALVGWGLRGRWGAVDVLALQAAGYALVLVAVAAWSMGAGFVRRHWVALALLVFIIPMPMGVEYGLEVFFQNTSAEAAHWFFQLTGTSVLRTGRTFELPGLTIEVAQECSGIRSSYVLFILSIVAGQVLLQRSWSRWFLTLFVIPLGILRNAFRILTISLLTIHWDPGVIHGPLHHRGGPVFFAISLIPFFGVLWLLKWAESRGQSGKRRAQSAEG
jgi:exosortase C (VPDSG-CTERM-specific)